MKETIIRKMDQDDLEQVMKIERQVFSDPWGESMFFREMESENAFVMKTKKAREIIGYICGIKLLDDYMITNIAIKSEEQHKGYGSKLMEFLLRVLLKTGCKRCFLEVRASNRQAIDFYLGYGFEIIGRQQNYYRDPEEDALVMQLDLQ